VNQVSSATRNLKCFELWDTATFEKYSSAPTQKHTSGAYVQAIVSIRQLCLTHIIIIIIVIHFISGSKAHKNTTSGKTETD